MSVSTDSTALDCTQRRQKISTASSTPSPRANSPSGSTGPSSRSVIGPSMRALVTRGIAMLRPDATQGGAEHHRQGGEVRSQVGPETPEAVDSSGRVGVRLRVGRRSERGS